MNNVSIAELIEASASSATLWQRLYSLLGLILSLSDSRVPDIPVQTKTFLLFSIGPSCWTGLTESKLGYEDKTHHDRISCITLIEDGVGSS